MSLFVEEQLENVNNIEETLFGASTAKCTQWDRTVAVVNSGYSKVTCLLCCLFFIRA